jgi:hypothetical protein
MMMKSNDYLENLALKKSILPVFVYLALAISLLYATDQVSLSANNFLGANNVKIVHILKVFIIGLLTTFLIFYLIYKYKFMEVNAHFNATSFMQTSPYPEAICKLKDYSLMSCSMPFLNLLGYNTNEIKNLTLDDIVSVSSMKALAELFYDKNYINTDFTNVHFVGKSKGLLSISVSILKFEVLDNDYVLLRCHNGKIISNVLLDEPNELSQERKKAFQF